MDKKALVAANLVFLIAFAAGDEARAASGCKEAEQVVGRFVEMEASGKRLYSNSDYQQLMTYMENGEEGDEPGWDSVHLVAIGTRPRIIGCRAEGGSFVVSVDYISIGEDKGGLACIYSMPRHQMETLIVKNIGENLKIDGLQIYQPYAALKVINEIAPTTWEKASLSSRCEEGTK